MNKKYFLWFVIVLSPLIIVLLRSIVVQNNLFSCRPVWSDELLYWRELFSVSERGFDIGYTEGWLGEGYAAPIGPLGCHGIAPILAWGWYALIFPIKDNSLMIANFIMLTFSLIALIMAVRPSIKMSISIIAILITYVPLVTYIPTSMMELPCYATIILYMGLLINYQRNPKKSILMLLLILVTYCTLLRICYAVLFFPLIANSFDKTKNLKKVITEGIGTCIATFFFAVIGKLFSSYWPYNFKWKFINDFGEAPIWKIYFHHGKENLINWFNPYSDDWLQALQRYLLILILIILVIRWIATKKWIYFGMFFPLGTLWVALIGLYDVWDARDYRTQAPLTFGIILWMILYEPDKKKVVYWDKWIAYGICVVPLLFNTYFPEEIEYERYEYVEPVEVEWETVLNNKNEPCTVGMWKTDNWNYSLIKSLPAEVGYSIVGAEVDINTLDTADFIITNAEDTDIITSFEYITYIPDVGQVWKKKTM